MTMEITWTSGRWQAKLMAETPSERAMLKVLGAIAEPVATVALDNSTTSYNHDRDTMYVTLQDCRRE